MYYDYMYVYVCKCVVYGHCQNMTLCRVSLSNDVRSNDTNIVELMTTFLSSALTYIVT